MNSPEQAITLEDLDRSPSGLPGVSNTVPRKIYEKAVTQLNTTADELDELKLKLRRINRENLANEALNDLIKPYAEKTFWFMCCYCGFIGMVLMFVLLGFSLPTQVLVTLVGSTAVTVLGLVGMVLTGIFVGARGRN